jgi:hypothetical protein
MTGIMTPAVRIHHFRFGTSKFQALGFCCTEYTSKMVSRPILRTSFRPPILKR